MKVCLDPGHGGRDPGACVAGVSEAGINLSVARLTAGRLRDARCETLLTREIDVYRSLGDRAAEANDWGADLFLSIHCNWAVSDAASGFEVWTSRGDTGADWFATLLFTTLQGEFPSSPARADYGDGDPDKERDLTVLVRTGMPAVLIELGFLSNSSERAALRNVDIQDRFAAALARGVLLGVGGPETGGPGAVCEARHARLLEQLRVISGQLSGLLREF